jgi:cyanophycinase
MSTVYRKAFAWGNTAGCGYGVIKSLQCVLTSLVSMTFYIPVVLILLMNTENTFANSLDRMDRSGIPGVLLICGGGDLPDVIFDRFLQETGGSQARLVVIPTARVKSQEVPNADRINAEWRDRGVEQPVSVLHTLFRQEADSDTFVEPLRHATGVWISGGSQSHLASIYLGTAVERELYALLARGGVIGGTSAGAAIQSRIMIARGNPDAEIETGFNFLPDSVIDQHFLARNRKQRLTRVVQENPGLLGFGVDEETALVVAGKHVQVLGKSTVTVLFASSETHPAQEMDFQAGAVIDLELLYQAVRERTKTAITRTHFIK